MNKHKTLTVNRLAVGNLKTRKKQYTLMIIGILLAMIFSSGILFFISCTKSSDEEYKRRSVGDFYGYFLDPQYMDVEQGKKDGYIENYGYAHILGWAYTDKEKQDKGTSIAWLDEDAKQLYYATIKEGRYPENKGEIAIESDAAIRLGIEPQIGEIITLKVKPAAGGVEYLPDATTKTYKVVGIFADKRKNLERTQGTMGYEPVPAAFVSDEEEVDLGGKEILALYFKPTDQAMKATVKKQLGNHTIKETPFQEYFMNKFYDTYFEKSGIHRDSGVQNLMTGIGIWYGAGVSDAVYNSSFLSITLAAVLMLASSIGIVNAFTTNLQERRRQIGLLRAVGTTKRQIINIFGREAFIISLICAPVSVVVSYFGVKLFAHIMGGEFVFMPNMWLLLGTTAVSVACVMAAALVPLMFAARISPMQAIRNVDLSRKMKNKKIKQEKNFVAPKLLAKRSVKFYKAKQVGVSVILSITILLTCFGFSILSKELEENLWAQWNSNDYVVRRSGYATTSVYVNMPNVEKGITANEIAQVLEYPLFTDVSGSKQSISYLCVDEYSDYLNLISYHSNIRYSFDYSNDLKSRMDGADSKEIHNIWYTGEYETYTTLKQVTKTEKELFQLEIKGYSQQMIENNLNRFDIIDGKIDIDKLNSGEEIILVAYEEAGFFCAFYDNGDVHTFGVRDLTEALPESVERYDMKMYDSAKLDYKVGDTIELMTLNSDATEYTQKTDREPIPEDFEQYTKKVKIGAIVKPYSFGEYMNNYDKIGIVTTDTGMDLIAGFNYGYEDIGFNIKGEINDEIDTAATDYLTSVFSGTYFTPVSGYAKDKENAEFLRILFISMIAIVILFFSICASIVNNALTAKIRQSKREIGTLRAVGASVKEITQSYIRQLLSMFGWGCGIGFGGYIVGNAIIKFAVENMNLSFEIWQAALIVALLFLICSINLYAKIKKEMKNSIVENIREL